MRQLLIARLPDLAGHLLAVLPLWVSGKLRALNGCWVTVTLALTHCPKGALQSCIRGLFCGSCSLTNQTALALGCRAMNSRWLSVAPDVVVGAPLVCACHKKFARPKNLWRCR